MPSAKFMGIIIPLLRIISKSQLAATGLLTGSMETLFWHGFE
jgi:hypothetical protein